MSLEYMVQTVEGSQFLMYFLKMSFLRLMLMYEFIRQITNT